MKITPKELFRHMEALPEQRFSFLVKHVLQVEDGMGNGPLEPDCILKLAFTDWMANLGVITDDNQQKVLAEFGELFRVTAKNFKWLRPFTMPPATLGIVDFRFANAPAKAGEKGFYDLKADKWIPKLPHHGLTLIYCDLNTLLTRLYTRIERTRKRQESKDAPEQPANG